jgi:hypothetical protein
VNRTPHRARPHGGGPGPPTTREHAEQGGSLTLELVLLLPVLALLVTGLLGSVSIVRDVLILHEAARVGARAAATSTGTDAVVRAAREAAPELPDLRVTVSPTSRRDGDLARVRVEVDRRLGPVTHRLRAASVAWVEPAVGTVPPP